MIPRTVAILSGVIGGACWVLRALIGGDEESALSQVLRWGGAMWLVIALVVLGIGVVRMGNTMIRMIIAVAMPVLGWGLISTAEQAGGDPVVVEAVAGAIAIGVFAGLLVARRSEDYD